MSTVDEDIWPQPATIQKIPGDRSKALTFTDFVMGDEQLLRYALSVSAAIMMPIAAWIMWSGVKPYGEAIAAIKIREKQGTY